MKQLSRVRVPSQILYRRPRESVSGSSINHLVDVIARLDRAIQYSRGFSVKHCRLWNTGSSGQAGRRQRRRREAAFPRRDASGFCEHRARKSGGRRECRVHDAPTALRAKKKRRAQAQHRYADITRHSLRNGLRLLRDLPGEPAFLPPSSRALDPRLVPCIGGTGPHGLTVRITPHVLRRNASIATRLTSGDEWPSRPPCRGGLASLNHNFCLSEIDIFLRGALNSSGKTGGGFSPARGAR